KTYADWLILLFSIVSAIVAARVLSVKERRLDPAVRHQRAVAKARAVSTRPGSVATGGVQRSNARVALSSTCNDEISGVSRGPISGRARSKPRMVRGTGK